jgi:hypothetical protein
MASNTQPEATMSIFDRIKTAIFGRHKELPATPPPRPLTPPPAATTPSTRPAATTAAPHEPVDIEVVMQAFEKDSGQKLNWRTSIVDLLKLLDIDSSLDNRKELAKELGYTGSTSDSATMNIWLHKQVLRKLQENGGKVPASLVD